VRASGVIYCTAVCGKKGYGLSLGETGCSLPGWFIARSMELARLFLLGGII